MNRKGLTSALVILGLCACVVGLVSTILHNQLAYGISWNVAAILWIGAFIAKE